MPVRFVEQPSMFIDQDLKDFAALIKSEIPSDYLAFLQRGNGGFSGEYSFTYKSYNSYTVDGSVILWFSIGGNINDPFIGIEGLLSRLSALLPCRSFPIAEAYGGHGVVIISIDPKNFGSIHFYDDEAPGGQSVFFIANSFSEFESSLLLTRER